MSYELVGLFGAILVTITASITLLINDWRVNVGLLAIQYIGAFALILLVWPLAMSISHFPAFVSHLCLFTGCQPSAFPKIMGYFTVPEPLSIDAFSREYLQAVDARPAGWDAFSQPRIDF